VSPVKYELGFYIPEDGILHGHRRENLGSYKTELKLVGFYQTYILYPVEIKFTTIYF
jgi:hypothetical protein